MFQLHNQIVYLLEHRMWNSHILTLVLFHDPVKNFCNVLENDIFLLAVQVLKGNELKRSKGTCFNLKNLIVSSKCTVNTLQLFSEKNTMLRWLIYRKWKDRKISVTLILILFSFLFLCHRTRCLPFVWGRYISWFLRLKTFYLSWSMKGVWFLKNWVYFVI